MIDAVDGYIEIHRQGGGLDDSECRVMTRRRAPLARVCRSIDRDGWCREYISCK